MISIVIPCYNAEKHIRTAVDHVLNQSNGDFQLVLVDDGSKDTTSAIVDEYADGDKRIKVLHQSNHGLMRAWKNGVMEADGDYIAFCDADDYLEADFVERVNKEIQGSPADIILYGITLDYEKGASLHRGNRIASGVYDSERIKSDIYPHFFSDGSMESWAINQSRCAKAIRKDLLLRIIHDLSDDIHIGEDCLTTFAAVLVADSILCIDDYYPYHYVRNGASMIGGYVEAWYEKFVTLTDELDMIADKYDYEYKDQIKRDLFSNIILYLKKDICNNPGGYKATRAVYRRIMKDEHYLQCSDGIDISGYGTAERVFAWLVIHGWYIPLYVLTRLCNRILARSI